MVTSNKYLAGLGIGASLLFYAPPSHAEEAKPLSIEEQANNEWGKVNAEVSQMSLEQRMQYIITHIVLPFEDYHSSVETSEGCNNYFLHLATDNDLTNRVQINYYHPEGEGKCADDLEMGMIANLGSNVTGSIFIPKVNDISKGPESYVFFLAPNDLNSKEEYVSYMTPCRLALQLNDDPQDLCKEMAQRMMEQATHLAVLHYKILEMEARKHIKKI